MNNNTNGVVTKADRIMSYVEYIGLMISAFAWGWNRHVFKKKTK